MDYVSKLREKLDNAKVDNHAGDSDYIRKLRKRVEKSNNPIEQVDSNFIDSFINDYKTYVEKAEKDSSSVNFGNASSNYSYYQSNWNNLKKRANTIRAYYNYNKDSISSDSYDDMMSYLKNFDDNSSNILGFYKNWSDIYSQFESEDDYNTWKNNNDWSQKYAGNTYGQLNELITSDDYKAKRQSGEISDDEHNWLTTNYMLHNRDVVDSMTEDELRDKENRKKTLEDEISKLKTEKAAWSRSAYVPEGYTQEDFDNKIKAKEQELANYNSVLYYDENEVGMNYETLLGIKTAENDLIEIHSNSESDNLYSAIEQDEKDIVMLTRFNNYIIDSISNPDNQNMVVANSPETQELIDYMSSRFGVDMSQNCYQLLDVVDKLSLETQQKLKSDKEAFSALGYDWKSISKYNAWKEDRANYKQEQENMKQFGIDHPIASTIVNILASPLQAVEYVGNIIQANSGDYKLANIYDDGVTNFIQNTSSAISQKIYDDTIASGGSDLKAWLLSNTYSGMTSMAQSQMLNAACVAMFGPAGKYVALELMGMEAANSSYQNAIKNGSTNGEALLTSIAAGIDEAFFEKYSIGELDKIKKLTGSQLWNVSTVKNLLKSGAKNAGKVFIEGLVGASEEGLTDLSNSFWDNLINGDHSEYYTNVTKLMNAGYTKEQAEKMATKDWIEQIVGSLFGGFIGESAAGTSTIALNTVLGTGDLINNKVKQTKYFNTSGNKIIANENLTKLLENAKALNDPKINKLVSEIESVDTTAEGFSEADLKALEKKAGKLYASVQNAQISKFDNSERQAFKEAVKTELKNKGIKNVDEAAEVITKARFGQLSSKDAKLFDSVGGREILNKVINSKDLDGATTSARISNFAAAVRTSKLVSSKNEDLKVIDDIDVDDRISESGKTTMISTGEEVSIQDIASIKDGKMSIKLNDGTVVDSADIEYGTREEALVYETMLALGVSATIGNNIIKAAKSSNMPTETFMKNVTLAYDYGITNESSRLGSIALPKNIRNFMFQTGREYAQKHSKEMLAKSQSRVAKGKASNKVTYVNKIKGKLNGKQKATIAVAEFLSNATSLDIYVFESYRRGIKNYININGVERESSANGWFVVGTNKIYIDINAGNNFDGLGLFTLAHESGHFIRDWNATEWQKMADVIVEEIDAQAKADSSNPTFEELLAKKYNKYQQNRKKEEALIKEGKLKKEQADYAGKSDRKLRDMAYEDVICDSLASLMSDKETFVEFANKLDKKDHKLWVKFKELIKSFLDKLDEWLKSYNGVNTEDEAGQAIQNATKEARDQIRELYVSAFIGANENFEKASKSKSAINDSSNKAQDKSSLRDDVQKMESVRYWYPNMSKSEITYVRRIAKLELSTTNNYIDNENKWLYNVKNGNTYFALYSTADVNEPTILYACKGKRAEFEHQFLSKSFEKEVDNNGDIYSRTKIIESILGKYGYVISGANVGNRNVVGGRSNNRNVGVYSKNSRIRPSEALLNCLRNIREIQKRNERNRLEQYSDRDTLSNTSTKAQNLLTNPLVDASNNFQDNKEQKNTADEGDVKHSFRDSVSGMANDSLLPYDNELKTLIEQRGDYIIDNFEKLKDVVNLAFDKPHLKATAYFGIIPPEIMSKIEKSIPNIPKELNGILFKPDKTYSVAATLDSIQHLADDKKLSRTDIIEYLDRVADTVIDFDTVNFDYYYQGNSKSKGVIFKKTFEDGKMQSFEIVSNKKRTLNLQTLYMESGDYQKKKSAETLLMDKPSANAQGAGRSDSTNKVPQSSENVKKNSVKRSDRDLSYFDAVNNNDLERAQKLVLEAARESGYDSPLLYHGTRSFGFTNFDLDKLDDGISIFLTSSEKIASTYSGISGTRMIQNVNNKNFSELSASELVDELNSYEEEAKGKTQVSYEYELYDFDKLNGLIKRVNDGINSLTETVEQKIEAYADKLAEDFNEDDYKVHSQLVKLVEGLKGYDYNNLSTPIYMLLHNTDVFEGSEKVANLEKNIRLMNKLRNADVSNGVIAAESMGGYWIDILSIEEARNELETKVKKGNYSLLAKLGKSLIIDGEGQLWKDIRNWSKAAYIKREDVEIERVDDEFRLVNESTGAEIENGILSVNSNSEKLSKDYLIDLMLDKANYSISILTENLHTTRDIAKWAKEKGYDSVTFKNIRDNGGQNSEVGFDETADIYVIFNPNDVKSADPVTYDDNGEIIPLSERFDSDDSDIRYSDRITADMSDEERARILEKRKIKDIPVVEKIPEAIIQKLGNISSWDEINNLFGKNKNTLIKKLASEFGVFKSYENEDIDLSFDFSNNNYRESYHKQKTNYEQFAKMFSVFDDVIKNAVGIEIHKREDYKPDVTLKNVYVLISAFEDGDFIVPVKLEVKEFKDKQNTLYVAISLQAIKKTEVSKQGTTENGVAQNSRSVNINVADLMRKVNSSDTNFTKYFPNELLTEEQRRILNTIEDIRFSDRNLDTDNRTLLSNALASTAQNEIEKKYIEQYQEKIYTINAEQKKLTELRAKIKELSFAKGHRDLDQIRKLRDEATKATNRINTFDKQLLKLETAKPLKEVLNREKALAKKKAEKAGREALDAYKERAAEAQRELMDKYQERIKKGKEGRDKTELRHKIIKKVKELNNLLLKGDKDHHVPLALQKSTALALQAINMDTVNANERIAKIREKIAKSNNPEQIEKWQKSIERIELQGENMMAKLDALDRAYEDIKNSTDPLIANVYDDGIKQAIVSLKNDVGDTPLREMSLKQLESVYDMYKMVLHTIRNANKAFKAEKQETITELGNNVMQEVEHIGGKNKYTIKALDFFKRFAWLNLKPVYAMKAIGSKTLSKLFDNVRAGEDTWAVDVNEAREYFLDKAKKYNYNEWDFNQMYTFKSKTGKEFSLSLQHIMSLYAYSKREQADLHLTMGGFVFDDATEVIEKKKGIPVKYTVNIADAHNISIETLSDIINTLTPEQQAFVNEMQKYLAYDMGAKGNEVSRVMYDIDLFKDKNYFPLKSAKQFMFEQNEVSGEVRIKNSGFTKGTVPKANNPIILKGFMDVWSEHVSDMAMYHSFVLPLEDFNRVFNYKTPTAENLDTESVKMAIQNAYGRQANDYIKNMLTDLNGGARSQQGTEITNKLISLFKKGAVFASASVVVQQPSAIARAMAYIDAKYFAEATPSAWNLKKHSSDWAEVKKYAPVAIIKEMGYFDTNMGKQTTDWITSMEYEGFGEKAKALVTDSGFRDDMLSKAPALADEIAWVHIWNAVKKEVADTNKALGVGSEDFLKECGKRFTEVVVNTQVYDSVLSRSALMRSKDTGVKMATAFMAEPTTSINMIADALIQGKRGDKKFARKAIGAVVAQMILNSILVSLVYAGRDDDEDKTYAEKYIGTLVGTTLDSINPLSLIPYVKDIVSIVQGYDVERSDMAVISALWNAYQNLGKDSVSPYKKVEDFAGAIANIFGLPLKNIMRDARTCYNIVNSFINGNETTAEGIKRSIVEEITGDDANKQIKNELIDAMELGDSAKIKETIQDMLDSGKEKSAIQSFLTSYWKPLFLEAYKRNDNAEMAKIRKALNATGIYKDVVETTQNWIKNSKPE